MSADDSDDGFAGGGGAGAVEVASVVVDGGDTRLSGLVAEPPAGQEPRALVVALHGGGMRAAYFHGQVLPTLSLLTLGASLGYMVLALDRPGYGASTASVPDGLSLEGQAALLWHGLDDFAAAHATGLGAFLLAHSYGGKVALRMGGDERGAGLLGLDVSGVGVGWSADVARLRGNPVGERELFWGPTSAYPPGTFARGVPPVAGVPPTERSETPSWPSVFPQLAARIRVPVRYTLAEHERWWTVGDEALAQAGSLFTASPRVEVRGQPGAGHNISLGWSARAYHLGALGFAEECAVAREAAERAAARAATA